MDSALFSAKQNAIMTRGKQLFRSRLLALKRLSSSLCHTRSDRSTPVYKKHIFHQWFSLFIIPSAAAATRRTERAFKIVSEQEA